MRKAHLVTCTQVKPTKGKMPKLPYRFIPCFLRPLRPLPATAMTVYKNDCSGFFLILASGMEIVPGRIDGDFKSRGKELRA